MVGPGGPGPEYKSVSESQGVVFYFQLRVGSQFGPTTFERRVSLEVGEDISKQ